MFKRIQFIEIQDLPQCPVAIRDGVTDYLNWVITILGIYKPIVSDLQKLSPEIVDMCAGGGGPWKSLLPKMPSETKVTLTDLYPNLDRWRALQTRYPEQIKMHEQSVNAAFPPASLKGTRTFFTSFHHFDQDLAQSILKSAFDQRQPIGIFEFTSRDLYSLLMVFLTPIQVMLWTPLIWPWKLSRFFWTYIIPAIPFVAGFDVVVSVFRTRTEKELLDMTKSLRASDYEWEISSKRTIFFMKVVYLIGRPK